MMARIRSVKPEFWTDGTMVELSIPARLFYIGTWNFALCDRGHLPDDPRGLKLKILPADDVDAVVLLNELLAAGRIVRRYSSDGRSYLFIPRLGEHQKSDTRWQSRCPHCASEETTGHAEDSPTLTETQPSSDEPAGAPAASPQGGKGGEGLGKEGLGGEGRAREPRGALTPAEPPPRNCRNHLDDPDPPNCVRCRTARKANEAWRAAKRAHVDAAPRCSSHPAEIASNCRPCASERKAATA